MKNVLVESIEKAIRDVENTMELKKGVLTSHNTIVYFPKYFMPISLDENGMAILTGGYIASQFTPEAAKQLVKTVKNGSGESPIAVGVHEYYHELLTYLKNMLENVQ